MAYIKTIYAGKKTFGGYLIVDGGVPTTISDGLLIKVDAGTHHIKYTTQLTLPAYYTKEYVRGSISATLNESDLMTFTIFSDINGHVLEIPSYEITKMTEDEAINNDNTQVDQFKYELLEDEKNIKTELILCILLGWLGVHKFYKGKIILGLLYMFSLGLCGIGWLIDLITIIIKLINIKKTIKKIS